MRLLKAAGKAATARKARDWVARSTPGARQSVQYIIQKLPVEAQVIMTCQSYKEAMQYDVPAEPEPVPKRHLLLNTLKRDVKTVPRYPEHAILPVRYSKATIPEGLEKPRAIGMFMQLHSQRKDGTVSLKTKPSDSSVPRRSFSTTRLRADIDHNGPPLNPPLLLSQPSSPTSGAAQDGVNESETGPSISENDSDDLPEVDDLLEVDNCITDAEHERLDRLTRSFVPLWRWRSRDADSSPSLEDLAEILTDIVRTASHRLNLMYATPDAARNFLVDHPRVASRLRTITVGDASFKGIRCLRLLQAPPWFRPKLPVLTKEDFVWKDWEAFYKTPYRGTADDLFMNYLECNDKLFGEDEDNGRRFKEKEDNGELFRDKEDSGKRFHAKLISIVQSPGTGKSRLVHELGKKGKCFLFYMNFGTSAFPPPDWTLISLLEPFDCKDNAEKLRRLDARCCTGVQKLEAIYCAFFTAIFRSFVSEAPEIQVKCTAENDLEGMPRVWYDTFFGHRSDEHQMRLFGVIKQNFWEAIDAISLSPEGIKHELLGDTEMIRAYDEVLGLLERTLGDKAPLLIVFDEAARFLDFPKVLEESEVSPSHILCRVIKAFSRYRISRVWTVFISADPRIRDFSRFQQTQSSDQLRIGKERLFRPFTELGLHQFAKPLKDIDLDRVWEYENLVGFGRPLWAMLGQTDFYNVIYLRERMLSKNGGEADYLAIISQRCCLDFVFGHPLTVAFEEEAVKGRARYLTAISEDSRILYSTYPTEPILSQAAADILWSRSYPDDPDVIFTSAIEFLKNKVMQGVINRGTVRELAARLLLLLAKDICAQELMPRENELRYCGSVSLIRWLKVLFGDDVFLRQENPRDEAYGGKLEARVEEHFGNMVINFSHWIGMEETIADPKNNVYPHTEWLTRLFATTAAIQCCPSQPHIDSVIPIFDAVTKEMSQVCTQVKNPLKRNKGSLSAMTPEAVGLCDAPCVMIMMTLGSPQSSGKTSVKVTLDEKDRPRLQIHVRGWTGETFKWLKDYNFLGSIRDLIRSTKEAKIEGDLKTMRDQARIFSSQDNIHWVNR